MAPAQLTDLSNFNEVFETSLKNDVDSILRDARWAESNISYAFLGSAYPMTGGQTDQMRKVFEMASSFTNFEFSEFTEGEA